MATTEERQIVVTCAASSATKKPGSSQPIIPDPHTNMFPVELLLSSQALVTLFRVLARHSADAEAPIYPTGCQGTHEGPCHGELWICSGCGSRICEAECTDMEPRLCYHCWDKQYKLAMMPDAQESVLPTSEIIVISCDCSEKVDNFGTCLELTPEGVLTLEDKDGLRVSIRLPQWLDEAIRKTIVLQTVVASM